MGDATRVAGPARVTLCVTGGIAAYKACTLARELVRAGVALDVLMTAAATRFVSPLTFEALCQRPVRHDLWAHGTPIAHVEQAHDADLIVVAPATAHSIGRFAAGLADDLVSATVLASRAPVLLAPAMETGMWESPIVQRNLAWLVETGRFATIGPEAGALASGRSGTGRMSEPEAIAARVAELIARVPGGDGARRGGALAGREVVVTAGPTREFLDPVRFLSNPSTGKMGFAIAAALAEVGARVVLVHGPVSIPVPRGLAEVVPVVSARDMHRAVLARAGTLDVYVGTAAVADYRPAEVSAQKIKKGEGGRTLVLERTPDVIASLVERLVELGRRDRTLVVGFAVETEDLVGYARSKLERKGLDLVAANDVTAPGSGFATDTNELCLVDRASTVTLGPATKRELGRALVAELERRLKRPAGVEPEHEDAAP